ncbi:MAG: hypothetical protein HY553_12915 [Elusimicrobia bacterium]|nr:hypothetical protein [Elusimicrobiota bacterium]
MHKPNAVSRMFLAVLTLASLVAESRAGGCSEASVVLPASTRITVADGSYKEAEELRAGDMLLSYDDVAEKLVSSSLTVAPGPAQPRDLVGLISSEGNAIFISTSSGLQILLGGGFRPVSELKVGDDATVLSTASVSGRTFVPARINALDVARADPHAGYSGAMPALVEFDAPAYFAANGFVFRRHCGSGKRTP